MAPRHPALAHRLLSAPVVADRAGDRSAARLMADAAALAERLPERRHVVNLCGDRYRFVAGFIAAMLRGQVTLLPSAAVPGQLEAVAAQYPDLYGLHDEPAVGLGRDDVFYPDDLAGTAPARIPSFALDQVAAVLFTSGSTGRPAPNPRRWGALVASARAAGRALDVAELAGGHILGTVPHQHSYGLESVVMLALAHGLAIVGERPFLPAEIVARLWEMPEPRILVTTPVHLRGLVAHDEALPPVARIVSATAPFSFDLARLAERRFGAPLIEIYGCSEVGQVATRRTVETEEWTCLDDIALNDRDGEIWASGPAAARPAPLNDRIELTGEGKFLLLGRKSDLVNVAGKRCSLAYLTQILLAVEGVRDGVFVMPDTADGSTRPVAYVVAPGSTANEILAALRREIDPAFLPRPLHLVEALPRNALGKLLHADIERLALDRPGL